MKITTNAGLLSVIHGNRKQREKCSIPRLPRHMVVLASMLVPVTVSAELFDLVDSTFCDETRSIGATTEYPYSANALVPVLLEEFDGQQLDRDIWRVAVDSAGDLNATLDANVDSERNLKVEDGKLKLILRREFYVQKEGFKGAGPSREVAVNPDTLTLRPFTAARVDTATKFNIDLCQPGRIDIKTTVPISSGLWPAEWIFMTDPAFHGNWSASGEIDIMEMFLFPFGNFASSSTFFGGNFPFNASLNGPVAGLDLGETHTWSVVWDSSGLSFLVDGVVTSSYSADDFLRRENGELSDPLVSRLPLNYPMIFAGAGFLPFILNADELADLDALGQVPYQGFYTENRVPIAFGGSRDDIQRKRHPAPFDHEGFYLILDFKAGGFPFNLPYFPFEAVRDAVNAWFPPDFQGVVTREELLQFLPEPVVDGFDVPIPLPSADQPLEMQVDYVRYYIAPGPTEICHKADKESRRTLTVNAHAARSHLDHGDYLGNCREQYVTGAPFESDAATADF